MGIILFFHQGHRAMSKNIAQAIPSQEASPPEFPDCPLPYWEHLWQQTQAPGAFVHQIVQIQPLFTR